MTDYDIIGDIHGHADALEHLLSTLGYVQRNGAYRHGERQVIFLGDLIDRGPGQLRTLGIVRSMVEAGTAQTVLGNHEFNAVAWIARNEQGEWSRAHTPRNRDQHGVFLAAVGEGSPLHHEWIEWFSNQPMWLDVGDLRIVHACWHTASLDVLGDGALTHEIVTAAKGTPHYEALEVVLKGPEIDMCGYGYADKEGHCRDKGRLRWWDPNASTLANGVEIPGGVTACDGRPFGPLPDIPLDRDALPSASLDVPVLYGHYWRSGTDPAIDNPKTACLDWSVAKDGPLVAYRWSGEPELTNDHLVAAR